MGKDPNNKVEVLDIGLQLEDEVLDIELHLDDEDEHIVVNESPDKDLSERTFEEKLIRAVINVTELFLAEFLKDQRSEIIDPNVFYLFQFQLNQTDTGCKISEVIKENGSTQFELYFTGVELPKNAKTFIDIPNLTSYLSSSDIRLEFNSKYRIVKLNFNHDTKSFFIIQDESVKC